MQAVTDKSGEDVEGIENDEDSVWKDYPIDTVLIRNEARTVFDVVRRIKQGSYIMDPDFQRDFIWSEEKQSKLIESVLLRIPLPVFYLAEDENGNLIVVDGLQRLSTFKRFVDNELQLKLEKGNGLNKKKFQDLSPKFQNRIEDCNLILYVIDNKVPERARLDIFERVNSGEPLTRQQMRNCLYMGKSTRFLKEESLSELFKKVTAGSLKNSTMRDREFLNRFCAFKLLPLSKYVDMDDFLALALKEMNDLSDDEMTDLSMSLKRGLNNSFELFGDHSFRRSAFNGSYSKTVINASLWDVLVTLLSMYPEEKIAENSAVLKSSFSKLMGEEDFLNSITIGTNNKNKVVTRFRHVSFLLESVLNA